VQLSAIYASPLERCRQTAASVASGRGLRVRIDAELGEVDYGAWTGRPLRQLGRTRLWKLVQTTPSRARFPGGESLVETQQRLIRAAERIAADHPRRVVAVVSHGDPIRLLLCHLAGAHIDLFQRLVVEPASVSAVAIGEGSPRILRVNDTGDLAGLVPKKRRVAG
jgi:probable phosphoglycerate mutase